MWSLSALSAKKTGGRLSAAFTRLLVYTHSVYMTMARLTTLSEACSCLSQHVAASRQHVCIDVKPHVPVSDA